MFICVNVRCHFGSRRALQGRLRLPLRSVAPRPRLPGRSMASAPSAAGYDFGRARVAIVTGGGSGIGRALCLALARRCVATVIVADVDVAGAEETAALVRAAGRGCAARVVPCEASKAEDVDRLISDAEADGAVDAFFANAGILEDFGGVDAASPELWERMMGLHVYQAVHAARRLLPGLAQRGGCFAVTSSAAGLMTQVGSVAYTTTKHASRALAEWLSVSYGDAGLHVACLCPQAVHTKMTGGPLGAGVAGGDGIVTAEVAATSLLEALEAGRFLALPHPEVAKYMLRKAEDVDRWIRGMRRVQQKVASGMLKARL